jgi:CDGSH-type Zn-finger protein
MSEPPSIECKPNGPYLVRNLEDFRDHRGSSIATQPAMALCRCGGSANKPFCDGTHRRNGFSSAGRADASADQRDSYAAKRITVHDNRSICAHSGLCSDALASVFRYKREPWIDPDGDAVEAIVATVRRCPSGALSYTLDGIDGPDERRNPSITVTKNGPYAVVGGVPLGEASWGQGASSERFTLCRCGGSKNKPFCDGTHWSIGFDDQGA